MKVFGNSEVHGSNTNDTKGRTPFPFYLCDRQSRQANKTLCFFRKFFKIKMVSTANLLFNLSET